MSYSTLILADEPFAVWALDEPDGVDVVYADGFGGSDRNGLYNGTKFSKGKIPITYSGTTSINNKGAWSTNSYSEDNTLFSIPSIDYFSSEKQTRSCSLEFWMNIELPSTIDRSDPDIIFGDSAVVKLQGEDTDYGNSLTGVYIKNFEYLVFRVGDYGKTYYESEVHVENFNAPLHVVCLYSPNSIQIVVNGKSGRKVEIIDPIFLPKPSGEDSRFFQFKFPEPLTSSATPFEAVSFDTVALYDYSLNLDTCKIHYVYGVGYSVNKNLSSSFGGTSYDFTMINTTPVKKIDYYSANTWNTSTEYNRLEFLGDDLVTKSQEPVKLYFSSNENVLKSSMFGTLSGNDYLQFPANSYSYAEIENYERITDNRTSGLSFKFSIPSTGHGTNEQQLFYIGSNSSKSYISAVIIGRLIYLRSSVNGSAQQNILSTPFTLSTGATTFFISIYVNGNTIKFGIRDNVTGANTTTNTSGLAKMFPLQDGYIRFGTAPVFFGNSFPTTTPIGSIKRFDGKLLQIDISNTDLTETNYGDFPEKYESLLYQAYPIANDQRFGMSVEGSFTFKLSLAELVRTEYLSSSVNDIRVPIAVDIGSSISNVKYTVQKVVNGVVSDVVSSANAIDLRYLHVPTFESSPPTVAQVYFTITGTLKSIDNEKYPGKISFLRILSYQPKTDEVDEDLKYLEITTDSRGSNPRLYSNISGSNQLPFKKLIDLKAKTDLYRSFNTGVPVGTTGSGYYETSNYLQLPLDINSTNSGSKIYSIMFAGRAKVGVTDINLISYDTTEVKWSTRASGILHPTNGIAKLYINGDPYDSEKTYNINVWNHYAIVFNETEGISFDDPIIFGRSGSPWQIDNLLITTGRPSQNSVKRIYSNAYSIYVERRGYGSSSLFGMVINDSEKTSNRGIFQPLSTQSGFSSQQIDVASTTGYVFEVSGSSYRFLYNENLDLTKIDDVQLQPGAIVLFKDQGTGNPTNGILRVDSLDGRYINFTRLTNPADNVVVYISGGSENSEYYFMYDEQTNSYTKTIAQKKIVSYTSSQAAAAEAFIR
jgi:hypothetical protein